MATSPPAQHLEPSLRRDAYIAPEYYEREQKPGFEPSDACDFWDMVNRQDWIICEQVQAGMRSRAFCFGYYAPVEGASLDIRRYLAARLGPEAAAAGADADA